MAPVDIQSLEDINKLPFTTKQDLRDNYPFGLFAVPMTEVIRIHSSSGTTGKPTVVGYTKKIWISGQSLWPVRLFRQEPVGVRWYRMPMDMVCLPVD